MAKGLRRGGLAVLPALTVLAAVAALRFWAPVGAAFFLVAMAFSS